MNENIDLTEILRGCPKGTEFYSSVHGKLKYLSMYVSSSASQITFEEVNSRSIIDGTPLTICYYRDGRMYPLLNGECVVFPSKTQRDWSKFERFWDKPKVVKFDPHTLQPFDKVLVKDDYEIWQVEFFSHISQREPEGWCQCSGDRYYFCIPYNEETKHLVGKKEDCPEYYKWWEE